MAEILPPEPKLSGDQVSEDETDSGMKSATEPEQLDGVYYLIDFLSAGIMGCFFLPWIRIVMDFSGYDLQKLPSTEMKLVWLIPASAAVALITSIGKQGVQVTARLAGVTPLIALVYYMSRTGQDLLEVMRPGAALTLILGAVLLLAPSLLKKTSVSTPPSGGQEQANK